MLVWAEKCHLRKFILSVHTVRYQTGLSFICVSYVLIICLHLVFFSCASLCVQVLFRGTECAARGTAPVSMSTQAISRNTPASTVYLATKYEPERQIDTKLMSTFAVV